MNRPVSIIRCIAGAVSANFVPKRTISTILLVNGLGKFKNIDVFPYNYQVWLIVRLAGSIRWTKTYCSET